MSAGQCTRIFFNFEKGCKNMLSLTFGSAIHIRLPFLRVLLLVRQHRWRMSGSLETGSVALMCCTGGWSDTGFRNFRTFRAYTKNVLSDHVNFRRDNQQKDRKM